VTVGVEWRHVGDVGKEVGIVQEGALGGVELLPESAGVRPAALPGDR
jgi:hypothetical protein